MIIIILNLKLTILYKMPIIKKKYFSFFYLIMVKNDFYFNFRESIKFLIILNFL